MTANLFLRRDATFAALIAGDSPPSSGWFNVKDNYGAVGDNVANDTTPIQNAINAAQAAGGGIVFFPAGTYKITSPLSITSPVTLMGCGAMGGASSISVIAPAIGINGINISLSSLTSVQCIGFAIVYPSASSAGTKAISLTCSSASYTDHCLFDNLFILNADTCMFIDRSINYIIRACLFNTYGGNGGNGIVIQNSTAPDAGDFTIDGNTFSNGATRGIILQTSGGARIINNKILSATLGGVQLNLPSGAISSLVMITGNSFEGIGVTDVNSAGVQFNRLGTTGSLSNVLINGNEFQGGTTTQTSWGVYVPLDANGPWISNLNICNNIDNTGTNGVHIFADIASTSLFSIVGNVGYLHAGTPTNQFMVATRASSDRGVVGPNIHPSNNSASNIGSTNTTTINPT
jgi:hypothetical protein